MREGPGCCERREHSAAHLADPITRAAPMLPAHPLSTVTAVADTDLSDERLRLNGDRVRGPWSLHVLPRDGS